MKTRHVVLVFAWIASAATLALADAPKSIRVPAGDLIDGIEVLAKQSGVDVIYDAGVVKGRKTQGVAGAFQSMDAFRELLDGTGLDTQEDGAALLITKPASSAQPADTLARASAGTPPEPKYQVTVAAAREESVSALYVRLETLKGDFYVAYNMVNDDPRYAVRCKRGLPQRVGNLLVAGVACSPKLKMTCSGEKTIQQLCTSWPPEGFCEHLSEVVARHPELRELLNEYDALAERYGEVQGQKLRGSIPSDSACGPRPSLP